jgi:SAM-dependent methyltransferase
MTNWKNPAAFRGRTACAVPVVGMNPLLLEEAGNLCPLCFAPKPFVVLASIARNLMKCSNCSVAYLDPRPAKRELFELFANEYITRNEDVEVRFGTRVEKSHKQVARFINNRKASGRILDIGCAGGYFLDRYFQTSAWEKWGVELSRFAAARATAKAIQVHVGDIHSADLPGASFDVVTVLDTFYYFSEPLRELDAIRRILKPSGLLVIVLPHADIHIRRNTGWMSKVFAESRTALLESTHLFFYNPKSMMSILDGSRFRVRSLRPLCALGQSSFLQNGLAIGYSALSAAAWHLSRGRLMLGPRFLVAATP